MTVGTWNRGGDIARAPFILLSSPFGFVARSARSRIPQSRSPVRVHFLMRSGFARKKVGDPSAPPLRASGRLKEKPDVGFCRPPSHPVSLCPSPRPSSSFEGLARPIAASDLRAPRPRPRSRPDPEEESPLRHYSRLPLNEKPSFRSPVKSNPFSLSFD